MAKHLEKFTKPFQESRIPFVLTEVITDGEGAMVDLVCRFANAPAAALLGQQPQELRGRRFTQVYPPERLKALSALSTVAFSGSCASLSYLSASGTTLQVVCYQVMYGVVACLLEAREGPVADTPALPPDAFPCAACVLELSREGLRCLSFNQHLGQLTGWSQRQLYDRFAGDFSALICPEDWPDLLQSLLDADREKLPLRQEVRLSCHDGNAVWVDFRARRSAEPGVFCVLLPEIQPTRQHYEQLERQQRLLEETRRALDGLLHTLPGAFLTARRSPDGPTQVTAVSDRLAQLLELEVPELAERLRTDPLDLVPPEHREELQSALIRSRVTMLPLRQLCPVRTGSGRLLQLALEGVWQPVGREEWVLYLTCSDRTEEKRREAELRLRTQLCDLLLDRSQIISLDYVPGEDVAHVETYDGGGHRATRRIEHYLTHLEQSPSIHPEDRQRLISALRRASAHPGTGSLEYRGNYDGRGWRWYRVSLVSLFDTRGDVYGLLGKAEDISERKAAAARFSALSRRCAAPPSGTLVLLRLDLTAGRILDIQGESTQLTGAVFANSAEASLRHLRRCIPDGPRQAEFARRFIPSALLDTFSRGQFYQSLEHPLTVEQGTVWARTVMETAENPDSRHVELFCTVSDRDSRRQEAALLALAQRDYAYLMTVDLPGGHCRICGQNGFFPAGAFEAVAARCFRSLAPTAQRAAVRQALRLETILDHLRREAVYTVDCPPRRIGGGPGRVRCSYLDEGHRALLITLEYR